MAVITINKNNTYTANDLFQWDANRILEIYGLTLRSLPEIHFANARMSKAIVKQALSYENGVIKVKIPNILLETAIPITVYVCGYEGAEFISRYSLTINVKARQKPEDYIAEDDEKIYSYNALENFVNNTVINLKKENDILYDDVIKKVNAKYDETISKMNVAMDNAISEMRGIVENATIAEADTLDGYNAEDFVLASKGGTTVFNSDGSITTNYDDGSKETVVFNSDGSITTTRNTLETGVKTEITRFNANGSITVEVN